MDAVAMVPEMATRPNLVEACERNRWLWRRISALVNIARHCALIRDPAVSARMLDLIWKHEFKSYIKEMYEHYNGTDEFSTVYLELAGLLRNVYKNEILRVHPKTKAMKFGPHDVVRPF